MPPKAPPDMSPRASVDASPKASVDASPKASVNKVIEPPAWTLDPAKYIAEREAYFQRRDGLRKYYDKTFADRPSFEPLIDHCATLEDYRAAFERLPQEYYELKLTAWERKLNIISLERQTVSNDE